MARIAITVAGGIPNSLYQMPFIFSGICFVLLFISFCRFGFGFGFGFMLSLELCRRSSNRNQ